MENLTLRATNTIALLKQSFLKQETLFDFTVSQIISGDRNKTLRQEITRQLTGETKPIAKCGMYAVSNLLKASFEQYSLFN